MNKMSIRKDDLVVVLSGKDKGKQGKVLEVMPKSGKVVVEKINVVSRHTKPRKQGEQGGIVKAEGAMYASSRRRPPSTPARCRRSAPSATSPPASATRSRATRRSASARSAAPRSERGGVNNNG